MKINEKALKFFLHGALISIGIIIGVAVRHYYNLPLSESINIIDLATLVTTIFLAVYIPEVLDRKLQVKRDKKELIEKRIDELQNIYRRMNQIVQDERNTTTKDILTINNLLDVAENKSAIIHTLLSNINLVDTSFEEDMKEIKNLCKEHRNLFRLDQTEGITNIEKIKEREEMLYNKIDQATCLLIFKISEA